MNNQKIWNISIHRLRHNLRYNTMLAFIADVIIIILYNNYQARTHYRERYCNLRGVKLYWDAMTSHNIISHRFSDLSRRNTLSCNTLVFYYEIEKFHSLNERFSLRKKKIFNWNYCERRLIHRKEATTNRLFYNNKQRVFQNPIWPFVLRDCLRKKYI